MGINQKQINHIKKGEMSKLGFANHLGAAVFVTEQGHIVK